MKRTLLKILLAILLTAVLFTVAFACTESGDEQVTVKSISIEHPHEGPYYKGDSNLDFGDVTLRVTYSNKDTEIIVLKDSMMSGTDRLKFQEAGAHTVIINYNGAICHYGFEVVDVSQNGQYLAIFYARGGTQFPTVATDAVRAFSVPEREGYIFDGWYANAKFDNETGAVLSWGTRAKEPYTMTANTAFYAKWVDVRVRTVNFYDYDSSLIYSEEIHYGEKIAIDEYKYPDELVTPGKTFLGWIVTNGNPDDVTVDLIVKASFAVDKCTVKVEYANPAGEPVSTERTFDYGTVFAVGKGTAFTKREKDGHTSRFVVYVNHAEDLPNAKYEELGEDQSVVLTEPYTTIKTEFTIITYKIFITNGKAEQTYQALKSGNIQTESTYANADTGRNFTVNWGDTFDFDDYTQDPDISSPTTLYDENRDCGYTGEWCYVVKFEDGSEVWYNREGRIWDPTKQTFEERTDRPAGETDREWTLTDQDGNYVAFVRNGILTAIKGDVNVKALYRKKTYEVKLYRIEGEARRQLVTFRVKYLADFNPYLTLSYANAPDVDGTEVVLNPALDVTGYVINDAALLKKALNEIYNPTVPGNDIEKFYLKENTDFAVKQYAVDGGYYLTGNGSSTDNAEEDWTIQWFTKAECTKDSEVKFKDTVALPKENPDDPDEPLVYAPVTVEITPSTDKLFCKDTDNRKYVVMFYYDYSFETDTYSNITQERYFEEKEAVSGVPVPNSISTSINDVSVQYNFDDWYDVPYGVYLKTGYRGNKINLLARENSVYCFAHYKTDKKVKVTIYDKTQSVAYIGKEGTTASGFDFEDCLVSDNSITYDLPLGTVFDMSMIYKGKVDEKAGIISGQYFYDNAKSNAFYKQYYGESGILSQYLAGLFGTGTETANLRKVKAVILAFIADYNNALKQVYNHDYDGYTASHGTDGKGEFGYYLTEFDMKNYDVSLSINTIASEYDKLLLRRPTDGEGIIIEGGITGALDNAGFAAIRRILEGINIDAFIAYYGDLINTLYEEGYTTDHTGLVGIGFGNIASPDFTDEHSRVTLSIYEKLLIVAEIIGRYEDFLDRAADYETKEETPKYETSYYDLNNAYEYNGTSDVKYMFGGWYNDAAYSTPYGDELVFAPFALRSNEVFYAKWTDITRGTEGLVYEEVEYSYVENVGGVDVTRKKYGYVLVDYTNAKQFRDAGYETNMGTDDYRYYVTTNDTGAVPATIETGGIELQIPASIGKYLNVTEDAAADKDNWNDPVSPCYKKYFVNRDGTYVQASATYSDTEKYYVRAEYAVIGIKAGALDRYARYVSTVTIPLNLYFLEEGAFRNCNIRSFTRTASKQDELGFDVEVTLPYVTVDNERGIYQWDANEFIEVKSVNNGYIYKSNGKRTLIAYSVEYQGTSYALVSGTETIGDYAFAGAGYIVSVTNTAALKRIGDYAFRNSAQFSTLGAFDEVVVVPAGVTEIGREAFINCVSVSEVEVASNSYLKTIGKDAFEKTDWYSAQRGIIALRFTDNIGMDTGIIIGYYSGALDTDYNKVNRYNIDGTLTAGGEYYAIESDAGLLLMSGVSDTRKSVVITFNVKSISESALAGLNAQRYYFTSVEYIATHAFEDPMSLELISFAREQKTDIAADAFYGLSDKKTVRVVFDNAAVRDTATSGSGWDAYQASFVYELK